ncbi:hypothetical protein HZS_3551 [Henneguya salminicola]|nr:hypothetical protein HZS_3551 [Henneguya salminicola]
MKEKEMIFMSLFMDETPNIFMTYMNKIDNETVKFSKYWTIKIVSRFYEQKERTDLRGQSRNWRDVVLQSSLI